MRLAPLATAIAVGFDTLRVNPLRTILSTLGVIIGVSALVAVPLGRRRHGAIGLTFGTYPARRAARLSPIDAIRHE